ncbi:MAG: DUF2878 domain-containing protein [Proteobacteria bacterium]|nr:DUF2878 domain-containing protein [Pseudomonadota bacterium]
MAALLNFAGYQAVWFCAVYGAAAGRLWPVTCALAVFVLAQLAASGLRAADLRLMGVALALGLALDGALAGSGILHYAAAAPALPPGGAPLWILALWVAFALTLNHSLRYLAGRAWLAAALGALGGPLAYLAAARLSGAVQFPAPAYPALAALAAGWAIALALLSRLAVPRPPAATAGASA